MQILKKRKILIVDDQINTLKVLMAILADEGYDVLRAASGAEALEILGQHQVDLILADLKMPRMDGLDLFHSVKEQRGKEVPPFIIMTAYGTVKSAVDALKEGVTNYLIKPLNFDELNIVLEKAIHERELSRELTELKESIREGLSFHEMIGISPKMKDLFDMVLTIGPTDASVLIQGETGTGKELLAKAIHEESRRKDARLVCINCAALAETLLEAELFGYVKGAFTGANRNKKGQLETADKGTLFLDEIAHMSLTLQAKLLRFLQEMVFVPVGGTESREVDVRLIAATNQDLQDAIQAGRFMSDLLYRINVISIKVPPLRERREDIPLMVKHFMRHYAREYEKQLDELSPKTMDALIDYDWPGNVRELKNCMARAVILSKESELTEKNFPDPIFKNAPSRLNKLGFRFQIPHEGLRIKDMEIELIRETLKECGGNKSLSAQFLGISRKTLYEKMDRYQILDVNLKG